MFTSILQPILNNIVSKKSSKENSYQPLIIAGASGAGKGTFVKLLQQQFPGKFVLSVSWTTRPMRTGEENGKQYFFKGKQEFLKEVERNGFLEYCIVHENLYGTSKQFINNVIENQKICILEIDVKGAEKVYQNYPNSLYVQIQCKNHQILEERLRKRQSDSEEQIQIRLKNAKMEVEELNSLSYFKTIINDDLQDSFNQFKQIILEFYPWLKEFEQKQ